MPENFQQQVLTELKEISLRLDRLETEVEKIDYKFDRYQKASDQVVRLAIIAAASVFMLSPALQALAPVIRAFVVGNAARG